MQELMHDFQPFEGSSFQIKSGNTFRSDVSNWLTELTSYQEEGKLLLDILGYKYILQAGSEKAYDLRLKEFIHIRFPAIQKTLHVLSTLISTTGQQTDISLVHIYDVYQKLKIQMERASQDFRKLKLKVLGHIKDHYPVEIH